MCAGQRADRDEPLPRWPAILGCPGNSVGLSEEKINELGQNLETGAEVQRAGRDA